MKFVINVVIKLQSKQSITQLVTDISPKCLGKSQRESTGDHSNILIYNIWN